MEIYANPWFVVGDFVEYFSASQGDWIPAKVVAANPQARSLL